MWQIYFRARRFFLPSLANTPTGHLHFGPVVVADEATALISPLAEMIERGNPMMETPRRGEYVTPVLAAAGVSSWSKFNKGLHCWLIRAQQPNSYSITEAAPGQPDTHLMDLTDVSPLDAASEIIRVISESLAAKTKPL